MSKLQTAQDTESQGNRAAGDLGDNRYKAVSEGKTIPPFKYKMMGSEVRGAHSGERTWAAGPITQEHQLWAQQQLKRDRTKTQL